MMRNLKWIIGLGAVATVILFNSVKAALDNGTAQIAVTPEALALFREVARDEMGTESAQMSISDSILARQFDAYEQYRESVGVSLQAMICDRSNQIWDEAEAKQNSERIPFEETVLNKLRAVHSNISQQTSGSQVLVMDAAGIEAPRAALIDMEAIGRVMEARAAGQNLPSCDIRTADFLPVAEQLLERSEIALGRGLRFGDMKDDTLNNQAEAASGTNGTEPDSRRDSDGDGSAQGG